jgi:hypothetical protein
MRSGAPSHRGRDRTGIGYSREFLESMARILVASGHSPRALAREFAAICRKLKEPARSWNPQDLAHVAYLPHVMAHWHADPLYADPHTGAPLALALRGRPPSVTALVARVFPEADIEAIVSSLLGVRSIRQKGALYIPTKRYVSFTHQRAQGHLHALMSLRGMLRTVEHNLSGSKHQETFLQRTATNPLVPVRALPAIHSQLKRWGGAELAKIDDLLRRYEVPAGSEPTVPFGVGAFAFQEPVRSRRIGRRGTGERQRIVRKRARRTRP